MATRLTTILVIVIVGATFIAGLIVGAQRDDASGPVDMIIVNGKVYPGDGARFQEAVAVRGNQILRVGSNRDVKRLRRPQTLVLDAHGGAVIPGLNDGRVQLMAGALALDALDLSPARTIDDLQSELRHFADDAPTRPWLVARNADETLLSTANVAPRKILDEASADRAALVTTEHDTIAWANSRALEMAAITRKTRNPSGGIIGKDRRTGEPTGWLKGAAVDLVLRAVPQPTRAEKLAAIRAAIGEAHKVGVTSVRSVTANAEELELLSEIRKEGDLTLRVYGSIAVSPAITEAQVAELDKLRQQYPDDPTLKLGAIEITCDQKPSASTCDSATLDRAIDLLDKHNWNVSVRTASGADVRAAVDAFAHAASANSVPVRDRRYRVDDTLLTNGSARVLFGSNWPAAALDPRDSIENSVSAPAELLPAVDAYTTHAAYATFDEQRKGKLAAGMLADIVILSNDIFGTDPDALRETAVTVTIVDGKLVYQRPTAASD